MRIFPRLTALWFASGMTLAANEPNVVYIALQDKLYDADMRTLDTSARSLNFYQQSILPANYPPIDDLASDPRESIGTIEPLGTIGGKRIFTVDYPSGLLAVVAEQQQDLFLPAFYAHRRVDIELLDVIRAGGAEFLAYVGDRPGNGNFKDEFYFSVVDEKLRRLDYEGPLQAELDRTLPDGYSVRKAGGFDIRTLTFKQSVWKDGDDNASPTGGEISVNFDFVGNALVVKSSEWRPDLQP
jgi:hypothetical protein